jgi:hypothetical protein
MKISPPDDCRGAKKMFRGRKKGPILALSGKDKR